jgi:hypothetical protein
MKHGRFPRGWITEVCLIAFIVLAANGTTRAADTIAQDVVEETKTSPDGAAYAVDKRPLQASKEKFKWDNFVPPRDERYDWIQLKSGEWLKGTLNVLYNFSLEFDSDELGLLTLDWEDIKQIRGAGLQRIRIQPIDAESVPNTVIGILTLIDNKVTITAGNEMQEFDRKQIIAIAEGTKLWKGKISLGANIRTGNTDLVDATFSANLMRRTAESRFVVDYMGNYSEAENVQTSNNHRLNSYYDIFITANSFWRTISAEYYHDAFINIDHQVTASSLYGYYLIRTPKTEWEVLGGFGALYKRFVSVEPGEDIDIVSPSVGLGTRYDTKLRSWLDYLFDFSFKIVDKDSGTYIQHLVTTLESDLIRDLKLDITFVWDRIEDPQPAADGTVPKKDDFQLVVGVTYEF